MTRARRTIARQMQVSRKCRRCGKGYEDDNDSPFWTCLTCRITAGDGGGCHWWDNAAPDPKVTRLSDLPIDPTR